MKTLVATGFPEELPRGKMILIAAYTGKGKSRIMELDEFLKNNYKKHKNKLTK